MYSLDNFSEDFISKSKLITRLTVHPPGVLLLVDIEEEEAVNVAFSKAYIKKNKNLILFDIVRLFFLMEGQRKEQFYTQ